MTLNNVCTFATATRCKVHCDDLRITWCIVSYIYFFGNFVFPINIWNMNFAGFTSQKNKEIFDWGQSTVRFFGSRLDCISFIISYFFKKNLEVLLTFNDIWHFLRETEPIYVLCELMLLHVNCWILCLLYIFIKTGSRLCWISPKRMKRLTCWNFEREMKTKRQSKERPNRWNLSAVLFLI